MGKGDKKTKRGKINLGTFGKTRPRKSKAAGIKTKNVAATQVSNLDSTKKK